MLPGCKKQTAMAPSLQTVTVGTVESVQPDTPERYSATIAPIAQVDLAFKSAGLSPHIVNVYGGKGNDRALEEELGSALQPASAGG